MTSIKVRPLDDDLSFGARITGVTEQVLKDDAARKRINDVFEERGVIVFEDMEPTSKMQVALSNVFGPLKDHPVKTVARVDQDTMPGVIVINNDPEGSIVEIDGQRLATWQPWHFDHCYNNELNRAGVLRAVQIAPEGGLTGFADGIQIYKAISPKLRDKIEGKNIIYSLDLLYSHMRFGIPKGFREIQSGKTDILEVAMAMPRAHHPAVWTRKSGEKVMHVSPWMAFGIEGQENAEGDALLEELCQEIIAKLRPYYHHWKPTDMVVWDNWRVLHKGSGCDPKYPRVMHRTTILGDYGLGFFEDKPLGELMGVLARDVM